MAAATEEKHTLFSRERSSGMPNTFGHIAVQAPLTKALFRDADPRWIYLGCIIPDLPWILQRAVKYTVPGAVDILDLRLTSIVLATLFASLVLAAAFSMLAERRLRTFGILALGATLHLLLDACQIKWANGVHLAAPFSWRLVRFDLFWPESIPTMLLTVGGVVSFVLMTTRARAMERWRFTRGRLTAAAALLLVYASLPLAFNDDAERADNHFVFTLRYPDVRTGSPIEFDRAWFHPTGRGYVLETFTGEEFFLAGPRPAGPAIVSVRGDFVDSRTIRIRDLHEHAGNARDWMSVFGLSAVAFAWIVPVFRRP